MFNFTKILILTKKMKNYSSSDNLSRLFLFLLVSFFMRFLHGSKKILERSDCFFVT